MGTMTRMRENTGVILWILVFAFGIIWVLQDSGGLDFIGQTSAQNLIVVDGESISYEEYRRAIDQHMEMYRQQTGESPEGQQREIEEQRVFDMLVEDFLVEREMDRMGIRVTDDEVYEMVLGDNPHPVIVANFNDGEGNVDRAMIHNFLENLDANPELREQWIQLEEFLRQERRRQKLGTLLSSTVRISDTEVAEEHEARSRQATAEFVALPYDQISDEEVALGEDELRSFYQNNRDDYRRERTYNVQYASIPVEATEEDVEAYLGDLENLRDRFEQAEDLEDFLTRHASDRPYSDAFFRLDELETEVASAIAENPTTDEVIGPVAGDNAVHLIRVLDTQPAGEPVVRARHILTQTQEEAQGLLGQIQDGADFAELAREHSEDPGSAERGGDLGWFGPGQMVQPFSEAAFNASPGDVTGPVESEYGFHLIEVLQRSEQEVQVAIYAQDIRASVATLRHIEDQLEDLSYYAQDSGDFAGEAERLELPLQEIRIEEDQTEIPGIGRSPALQDFLERSGEGDISDVIELDDQFLVARITSIQDAGYYAFEDVREDVERRAIEERKRELQRERLTEAYQEHGFDGLAGALGTQLETTTGLSYRDPSVSGYGHEPTFAGRVLALEEGEESGVVTGRNAAYIARVTSLQEAPELTDEHREELRQELLQQRRMQLEQAWVSSLRDEADVRDNRHRLFQ